MDGEKTTRPSQSLVHQILLEKKWLKPQNVHLYVIPLFFVRVRAQTLDLLAASTLGPTAAGELEESLRTGKPLVVSLFGIVPW